MQPFFFGKTLKFRTTIILEYQNLDAISKSVQMSRVRPSILDSIKIVIFSARFKCLKQALEEIN